MMKAMIAPNNGKPSHTISHPNGGGVANSISSWRSIIASFVPAGQVYSRVFTAAWLPFAIVRTWNGSPSPRRSD